MIKNAIRPDVLALSKETNSALNLIELMKKEKKLKELKTLLDSHLNTIERANIAGDILEVREEARKDRLAAAELKRQTQDMLKVAQKEAKDLVERAEKQATVIEKNAGNNIRNKLNANEKLEKELKENIGLARKEITETERLNAQLQLREIELKRAADRLEKAEEAAQNACAIHAEKKAQLENMIENL